MKKKVKLIFLLVIVISFQTVIFQPCLTAQALSVTELENKISNTVANQLDDIDFSELDNMIKGFDVEQKSMFGNGSFFSKVGQVISGKNSLNYESFLQAVGSILLSSVVKYAPLFCVIILIGVVSSLLGNIKGKFKEKSIDDITHLVCFCMVIIVCASAVKSLLATTTGTIFGMKKQMDIIFPILITFMTATGGVSSVAVYQPAVAILSSGITQLITSILLPLFLFSFVFTIIGKLSNNVKLDKFNAFFISLFKWTVGIVFTVFFAFLSIQGISAGSFDSISIRTAKFSLKSYVPIMGGYLSEGFDLIMASSVLIKNAVGLVGIVLMISMIMLPLIEILIFSLELKLAAAILEPLSNNKTSDFLSNVSKCITMLLSCLIMIGFMYFITSGLMMATANVL